MLRVTNWEGPSGIRCLAPYLYTPAHFVRQGFGRAAGGGLGWLVSRIVELLSCRCGFASAHLLPAVQRAKLRHVRSNTGIRPPQGLQGAHHGDSDQYADYGRILRLVAGD
jgi:hypothetical protein